VREPRIKYFKVPKLGSLVAARMSYNSCLSEEALDAAVDNLKELEIKRAEQMEEMKEWQEEVAAEQAQAVKEGNDQWVAPEKEWVVFEPEPYKTVEQGYVICIDKLGQDEKYSDNEVKYTLKTV